MHAVTGNQRPMTCTWQRGYLRTRLSRAVVLLTMAGTILTTTMPCLQPSPALAQSATMGASGLPVPRFVSLKAQPVNMRKGPGIQYPIAWVLQRAGMPLEIVREYDGWREVRDSDGTTGWVLGSLLSGRRTAVVAAGDGELDGVTLAALHERSTARSGLVARLEVGAVVDITSCDGTWCRISLAKYRGYLRQKRLWGVYPGERIE